MVTPGTEPAIFTPSVKWAPLGSSIPAASLAFKAAWPSEWNPVLNFEDNIGLDTEAEFIDIPTKDRGSIGKIPDGPGSIQVTAVSQSVPADLWALVNNFTQVVKAAVTTGTVRPQLTGMKFDPKSIKGFMLGFEGFAKAGSFFENDQFVRAILFNCQPSSGGGGGGGGGGRSGGGGGRGGGRGGGGDSRTLTMGWGGEDSWNKVTLGLEAVAYSAAFELLMETGYDSDLVDDEGRMLFVFHDLAA